MEGPPKTKGSKASKSKQGKGQTDFPSITPSPQRTSPPSIQPMPSPTPPPIDTPTPTGVPVEPMPTPTPVVSPTTVPVEPLPTTEPVDAPTGMPDGDGPTTEPVDAPTGIPGGDVPTMEPIDVPTQLPDGDGPTTEPIDAPTRMPDGDGPTTEPVEAPTGTPDGGGPTTEPVDTPTRSPDGDGPTTEPIDAPTGTPADTPTAGPSDIPTAEPIDAPTVGPTNSPTAIPAPAPTRPPDERTVPLSPWRLEYALTSNEDPSDGDFSEAIAVTREYLQEFMVSFFRFSEDVNFESMEVISTGTSIDPVTIDFSTTIEFADDSTFIPSASELDVLLASAFQQPTVQTYLLLLRNLPLSDPFQTTVTVAQSPTLAETDFGSQVITAGDEEGSSISATGAVGIAGVLVLLFSIAGYVTVRRSNGRAPHGKYAATLQRDTTDRSEFDGFGGDVEGHEDHASDCISSMGSATRLPAAREDDNESIEIEFSALISSETSGENDPSEELDPLFRNPFAVSQADLIRESQSATSSR